MKTHLFRTFAAILAVTAVAGGWRDAPMAPAPEGAGFGVPARRNVSVTPLEAYIECTPTYSLSLVCTATAFGGTGTGYTFEWSSPDAYNGSYGGIKTYDCYNDYFDIVAVEVSDSGDGYAYAGGAWVGYWCFPW